MRVKYLPESLNIAVIFQLICKIVCTAALRIDIAVFADKSSCNVEVLIDILIADLAGHPLKGSKLIFQSIKVADGYICVPCELSAVLAEFCTFTIIIFIECAEYLRL